MFPLKITRIRAVAATGALAMLAGCVTPPPPPPPPPPPVVIPPRPVPPLGAAASMTIPMVDQEGIRRTPNYRLTSVQTTWNLRSAFNVAALNCLDAANANILPAYKSLLTRDEKKLAQTNKDLMSAFRAIYGNTYRDTMDDYLTQVYNYFALPPVNKPFCQVMSQIADESLTVQPDGLDLFAAQAMPRIEAVFEDFFRSYEAYLEELRKWNSMYGTPIVTVYASAPPFNNPLRPEFNAAPPPTNAVVALPTLPGAGTQAQGSVTLPGTAPAAGQSTVATSAAAPSIKLPVETLPGAAVPVSGSISQPATATPQPLQPAAQATSGPSYGPQADPGGEG